MEQSFYVNRRLSYSSSLCTVRYVGPVKGTQGQWLGVEWDDPARGKHSGDHGGVRYFECRSKYPTAGSFVRPNRPCDSPRSFLEALHAKYASEGINSLNASDRVSIYEAGHQDVIPQKPVRISGKIAEEVGFDKIKRQLANFQELRIVILDGLTMSQLPRQVQAQEALSTGTNVLPEDISKTCPRISELDLSRNLFEDWREIAYICSHLDHLKCLRLDGNRLSNVMFAPFGYHDEGDLEKVLELSLSNTLFTWQEIVHLACSFFPQLTSLVASNNEFTSISKSSLPQTLRILDLEDNDFTAITDIQALSGLPNLQRLSLRNNKICRIEGGIAVDANESDSISLCGRDLNFPETLAEVDLSYNEISDWSFISHLHRVFFGMTSLRIAHNPLFQESQTPDGKPMTADDGYAITIARLPRLKSLNFSPVTAKERFNAETFYLSLIAAEIAVAPKGQEEAVTRNHWRYKELCKEYDDPVVRKIESTVNPNSLAARLIKLHFRVTEKAVEQLREVIEVDFTMEVPKSLQVYSVMGYVGKRLGVAPMKIKLVWETDEWDPIQEGSGSDDDADSSEYSNNSESHRNMVKREVVIVAGTRAIGTWIDGSEARVRIELMGSIWHSNSERGVS